VIAALLALAWLAMGHLVILHRSLDSPTVWLRMSLDGNKYLAMTQGKHLDDPLFNPRPLVPWLAAHLPWRPDRALMTVSYASLAVFYLVIVLLLRRFRCRWPVIAVALCGVVGNLAHLLNYSNPFLTDSFALAALSIMLYALVMGRDAVFAATGLVGLLGRETCLFGFPAYAVTRRWKRWLLFSALALGLFIAMRHGMFGGYDWPSPHILRGWIYWAHVYTAFGFLWWPMLFGVLLWDWRRYPIVPAQALSLGAGAFLTSLMSSDMVRMIGVMQVIAPLLLARYFSVCAQRSVAWLWGFAMLAFANLLWAVPSIAFAQQAVGMTELEQWYFRLKWSIIAHQGAGAVFAAASAWAVRDELFARTRANVAWVVRSGRMAAERLGRSAPVSGR